MPEAQSTTDPAPKRILNRRDFLRLAVAAAAGAVAVKLIDTLPKGSSPILTSTDVTKPAITPAEAAVPAEPTPGATETVPQPPVPATPEKKEFPPINISGTIERIGTSRVDRISIFLPKEVVSGPNPIVPKGETGTLYLEFDPGIDYVEWVNVLDLFGLPEDPTVKSVSIPVPKEKGDVSHYYGSQLVSSMGKRGDIKIDDASLQTISKISFHMARYNDGKLGMAFMLPNKDYTFKDIGGEHLINPWGNISFRSTRGVDTPLTRMTGTGRFDNPNFANINRFEFKPPITIKS